MLIRFCAATALLVGCAERQPSPTSQAQPAAPPQKVQPPAQPATTAAPAGQVTPTPPAQPVTPAPPDGQATPSPTTAAPPESLQTRKLAALKAKGPKYVPRTHHKHPDGSPKHINRLIFESSPYLLQHAHNPVDWYPWGPEPFDLARKLGRPLLMSIGYATCHWCHVMEEESFEDVEIAQYMNDNFVCIKVDREERPDVDDVYMTAVNMLHGRGGWPMTIVMTPDKQPFFGGTYFPPRDGVRGSRKGFLTILRELKAEYDNDRDGVVAKAAALSQRIARQARSQPAAGVPNHTALQAAANRFVGMHDKLNGGFGRRPKFPRPVTLDFLLRYHRRTGDKRVLDAVLLTLDKMAGGGLHDQVGGGFHRYTVDGNWLTPHFEKMLYDNGQLTMTYLAAYQITKKPEYAAVARRTLDYVAREMRDPGGAFWSATDADSEGHEGKFFVWSVDELQRVLGPGLADIAIRYWGATPGGNFEGHNILNVPRPHATVAAELAMTPAQLTAKIAEAAQKLYDVRKGRIPPLTDDKVLTSWNGLMISAFARGSFVLGEPRYAQLAETAAQFLLTNLRTNGRLLRTWKAGSGAKYRAYLEDYAFLGQGLIDLYEATDKVRWLNEAKQLHEVLLTTYHDKTSGGFFRTAHDAEKLLVRDKPDYDGAQPSGNSIAARNLLRLWEYTGDARWRTTAEGVFKWAAMRIQRGGVGIPAMLSALDHYLDQARQVILVQAPGDAGEPLRTVLRSHYLPNRLYATTAAANVATLGATIPPVQNKVAKGGKATAYVCERGVCKSPTNDPAVLLKQLADVRPYVDPTPASP